MTSAMKMMMARSNMRAGDEARGEGRGEMRNESRNEMGSGGNEMRMGYANANNDTDMEMRFRDRRGRPHYNNGRFAPRSEYGNMGGEEMMEDGHMAESRSGRYDPPRMNPIGFASQTRIDTDYGSTIDAPMRNEGSSIKGGKMEHGGAKSSGKPQFSKEMAEKWLKKLKNGDGSKGPHWEMEQAKQIMVQQGHKCDPLEFWAALNIMYSDYYNVARKINMNTASFYAELAAAFLMDEDAVEDKLAAYYENVVQHE